MKKEINQFFNLNPKCNEVDLFRHTSQHISKKHKTIFIEEGHQCYVNFIPTNPICKIRKKEISDLWIITYSPKQKKGKMTFLQAKYTKKKKPVPIPFKFSADYFQYDLLKNRPIIKNLSKLNLPPNILKSAKYDSIGTYGIYYYDNSNLLHFSFSVASDLTFKGKVTCKTKTKTLQFEKNEYFLIRNNNDLDLRNTLSADTFECALLHLMIGSPIEDDVSLLTFLKQKFQGIGEANDFNNFLNSFDTDTEEINDVESYMHQNILIINVDELE